MESASRAHLSVALAGACRGCGLRLRVRLDPVSSSGAVQSLPELHFNSTFRSKSMFAVA
jgi:hypothetical protein